jgi:hypothetical protein
MERGSWAANRNLLNRPQFPPHLQATTKPPTHSHRILHRPATDPDKLGKARSRALASTAWQHRGWHGSHLLKHGSSSSALTLMIIKVNWYIPYQPEGTINPAGDESKTSSHHHTTCINLKTLQLDQTRGGLRGVGNFAGPQRSPRPGPRFLTPCPNATVRSEHAENQKRCTGTDLKCCASSQRAIYLLPTTAATTATSQPRPSLSVGPR